MIKQLKQLKQLKLTESNIITSLPKTKKPRMATFDEMGGFEIKQHLDFLAAVEGNSTSMLTIMIPGTMSQFYQMRQKLSSELGCASNIKNRVNRQSV
jgi:hypothetical protein